MGWAAASRRIGGRLLGERTLARIREARRLSAMGAVPGEARSRRAEASAIAAWMRLDYARSDRGRLGRVPLASLRCLDPEPAPVASPTPLGWQPSQLGDDHPLELRMAPGTSIRHPLALEPGVRLEAAGRVAASGAANGGATFSATARSASGELLAEWSQLLGTADGPDAAIVELELPAGALVLELGLHAGREDTDDRGLVGIWGQPALVVSRTLPAIATPMRRRARAADPPRFATDRAGGAKVRREADGPQLSGGGPLLSVLMPVRDPQPGFLDRALASVLRQDFGGWELRVHDDGSTDPSVARLLELHSAHDGRIHLTRSERPAGISAATNRALAAARGRFVVLLDHDDELNQAALETMAAAIAAYPDADLLYSDEALVGPGGEWRRSFLKPAWSPEYLESNMYTCHLGAYRRSLVVELGGFRSELDGSQDFDLALRLGERVAAVVHVPASLYRWRSHLTSSAAGAKPYAYEAGRRALEEHFARVGRPRAVTAMALGGAYGSRPVSPPPRCELIAPAHAGIEPRALARSLAVLARAEEWVDFTISCPVAADADRAALQRALADEGLEAAMIAGGPERTAAKLFDLAAARSSADVLVYLPEPCEPHGDGWLTELTSAIEPPGVGAAGTLTSGSSGRIERGAVYICGGVPLTVDLDERLAYDDPQRPSSTQSCVRNYSAVSAPIAISRAGLEHAGGLAAGGFSELAEYDLCMRLRDGGLRVALAPGARMARTQGEPARVANPISELVHFQRRWWSDDTDPYSHPAFPRERAGDESRGPIDTAVAWRPPASGAAPDPGLRARGVREELASVYLRGEGLEIGALHSPLGLPRGARARYVDRMPVSLLRDQYPELRDTALVEVDIVDDGERLDSIDAASQDFVVANHLLEHAGDPIGTFASWLRVLRPGGIIFAAVPDKRFTFDSERPVTALEHLIRDHEQGPEVSRRQHFEEWARDVEGVGEAEIATLADRLEEINYSVHTHVWTERELLELLLYASSKVGPFGIEALRRNDYETIVVLRKRTAEEGVPGAAD